MTFNKLDEKYNKLMEDIDRFVDLFNPVFAPKELEGWSY